MVGAGAMVGAWSRTGGTEALLVPIGVSGEIVVIAAGVVTLV